MGRRKKQAARQRQKRGHPAAPKGGYTQLTKNGNGNAGKKGERRKTSGIPAKAGAKREVLQFGKNAGGKGRKRRTEAGLSKEGKGEESHIRAQGEEAFLMKRGKEGDEKGSCQRKTGILTPRKKTRIKLPSRRKRGLAE